MGYCEKPNRATESFWSVLYDFLAKALTMPTEWVEYG